MHTFTTHSTSTGVDPAELDRHIAEMYRDVANEAVRDLHFPTGLWLAEALGYPAELLRGLPTAAVNSFAGVGYHFGLARLLPGERVLDLGSGSGMDVFAAASLVGAAGSVIGVDITRAACQVRAPAPLRAGELPSRADRGTALRERLLRRRDLQRRDQPVGRQATGVRRGRARAAAGRAARACRHRDRAADRRAHRMPSRPVGGVRRRASATDLYQQDIAAAGLELQIVRANPGYHFTSERARSAAEKYGARSISLLALKTNTTTNQEVSHARSH